MPRSARNLPADERRAVTVQAIGGTGALLGLANLIGGAGQGLDVVAELVGDDIGAGEVGA